MNADQDKPASRNNGFWTTVFKAEALVQIVWAVVIGIVAVTAILVFGGK